MTAKQKIAEIIAARNGLPVDYVIDQLNQMLNALQKAEVLGVDSSELEEIWADWTWLEPDYLRDFILENL